MALAPALRQAAAYMRMSIESQDYSVHHQQIAIDRYAAVNGIKIVKVYTDAGRSGLNAKGCPGLLALLDDVRRGVHGHDPQPHRHAGPNLIARSINKF